MILAVVAAVIVAVLCWSTCAWYVVILLCTVAGAAGGAVGAAIEGTPIGQGALVGAQIGFMIGCFAVAAGGATNPTAGPFTGGEGFNTFNIPIPASPKIAVSLALGTLSKMYMEVEKYKNVGDEMDAFAKEVNKLKEKARYRENAIHLAMSMIVDNPNKVQDWNDVDGDNDRNEFVTHFSDWWKRRMMCLKGENSMCGGNPYAGAWIDYGVQNFLYQAQAFSNTVKWWYEGDEYNLGYAERADYRWTIDADGEDLAVPGRCITDWTGNTVCNGVIAGLLRTLSLGQPPLDRSYGTSYALPGPTPAEMNAWGAIECCPDPEPGDDEPCDGMPLCSQNPPPYGYDNCDKFADFIRDTAMFIDELVAENLGDQWEQWIDFFYDRDDPSDPDTIYNQLEYQRVGMGGLRSQLMAIRDQRVCTQGSYYDPADLNSCQVGCWEYVWDPVNSTYILAWNPAAVCYQCFTNPPCYYTDYWGNRVGTVDQDYDDEFYPAFYANDIMTAKVTEFRDQIKQFAEYIGYGDAGSTLIDDVGGSDPRHVKYQWSDLRGTTTVEVHIGDFKVPKIKTKKSWSKVCAVLKDYKDLNGQRCWVRVTRRAPEKELGPLGKWNPFARSVTKVSRAYYSYNKLGLKDTKMP
ncbi:MAG: hypothetical protein V1863_01280 [Candidatus Omnitrophota bacterium]